MHYKKTILSFIVSVVLIVYPSLVFSQQLGQWTTLNHINVSRFYNVGILAKDTIIYTLGGFDYNTTPYPVEKTTIKPVIELCNF